jgi:hypothetical protein
MSTATPLATPLPVGATIASDSLRAALETRRAKGERYDLAEATALLVPLCVDLAQHHEDGQTFFVTPSTIQLEGGHPRLDLAMARVAPTLPRDKACLAPEERQGQGGNARSSVFSVGAILYEMVTGESVGPGMQRPTEIAPQLPQAIEVVLSKALVSDPSHRPDDLKALAQALHNLAPDASAAVPSANEAHLDGDDDFEVDVRLSMLPPAAPSAPRSAPIPSSADPYGVVAVQAQRKPSRNDPTTRLADLKARLESDTRPRYVVVQDGMDHGPFGAVELLQQIASHQFTEDSVLRDTFSQEERMIKDWEEFAPFAEQAKLHREIKAEKVELEKTITAEKKATTSKALIGGASLGAITLIIGAIVLKARGTRDDSVLVTGDTAVNVDVAGGVKNGGQGKPGAGGPGVGGRLASAGGFPVLPSGLSCEGAQAKYAEEMKIGEKGAVDLTQGQFAAVLNNGSYLNGCGVPDSTQVNICAAVQNGRAVGVTVTMQPSNPAAQSCVAGKIRGLSFPSNPKLDIARTTFK